MSYTLQQLKTIYGFVMGYGTEAGSNPYSLSDAEPKRDNAGSGWNELKVWLDDGDGVDEAGEKQTLASLNITELNYSMGTFTQNGQIKQLASPDLEADSQGTRVSVVPEGILVQSSENGRLSLLVTRIDDKTAVEAANEVEWRVAA
ncbi:MAG: hypothetical protein M0Z99_00360 [Betaproteobacteria bacterium]|nr:hypothetical protein [Betaproteobacteria bacterium]